MLSNNIQASSNLSRLFLFDSWPTTLILKADLVIEWNSILHETGEKLTKVLINYWQDQQTIQQLEFERLRAELEEREQINQETWQQVTDILNKIKEGVQEEQKARRPTSNRIIKQASKVRLIEPTQSQSSTPMSSSTQTPNHKD